MGGCGVARDAAAGLIAICVVSATATAATAPQGERLGTVAFPTSCSADAQPALERGLALRGFSVAQPTLEDVYLSLTS